MSNEVERNLEDIKVGDSVFISKFGLRSDNLLKARIETISKITPSGQFRLKDNDTKFDKNGCEIIPNKSARYNFGRNYTYIYKTTQELLDLRHEQFVKYKTIKKAEEIIKNLSLDYENALRVIELFGDEENK